MSGLYSWKIIPLWFNQIWTENIDKGTLNNYDIAVVPSWSEILLSQNFVNLKRTPLVLLVSLIFARKSCISEWYGF